jgi:guanine deaminase
VGVADDMRSAHPQATVTDFGAGLISAGFIDAHVHYPQTAIIASWGKRLIDWLNTYTFPEEMRFADPAYAAQIADRYFDLTLANGTTTVCSYCTIHPESVDAFFTAAQTRGLRALAGKTCMDRNAPDGLRDTPQTAHDDSAAAGEMARGGPAFVCHHAALLADLDP